MLLDFVCLIFQFLIMLEVIFLVVVDFSGQLYIKDEFYHEAHYLKLKYAENS